MTALGAAAHLDALQNFRLESRSETFGGLQPIAFGRGFQLVYRADPQCTVQFANAIRPETRDAQHLQHALGDLLAHRVETWMVPRLMQFRDQRGERVPNAWNLL